MASPTVETLAELREARDEIDEEIVETIAKLRKMHASWADIAKHLGVTRQAAHERYSRLTG